MLIISKTVLFTYTFFQKIATTKKRDTYLQTIIKQGYSRRDLKLLHNLYGSIYGFAKLCYWSNHKSIGNHADITGNKEAAEGAKAFYAKRVHDSCYRRPVQEKIIKLLIIQKVLSFKEGIFVFKQVIQTKMEKKNIGSLSTNLIDVFEDKTDKILILGII